MKSKEVELADNFVVILESYLLVKYRKLDLKALCLLGRGIGTDLPLGVLAEQIGDVVEDRNR